MILIDTVLKQRATEGRPVRIAVTGAGWMGERIAWQVETIEGLELVGIVNRTVSKAVASLESAGRDRIEVAGDAASAAQLIRAGVGVATSDPSVLCTLDEVDVVIEATGDVEYGARVALTAIEAGKHLVLNNAELDATLGPVLKVRADRAGVVLSGIDGDEPGVAMNLIRLVRTIGLRPVLVGNIKGFLNHQRNPETQRAFADQYSQDAAKIASFADGTKLAAECTVLANATGFRVARPGMNGYELDDVSQLIDVVDPTQLVVDPVVDFVLGARPGSGVFVVGHESEPERREAMEYLKMGAGPLYVFTRPFHLPHLEAPLTAARAALFGDATVTPIGGPVCDMIAYSKRDLEAGEVLDGVGGFTTYALIHNADEAAAGDLLPMGLSIGATLRRAVAADTALTMADVELAEGLVTELRREQDALFGLR